MKLQKQVILAVMAISAALFFCSCGRTSSGSGIFQGRMGSGTKTEQEAEQTPQQETDKEADQTDTPLYVIVKIDTEGKEAVFEKVSNGRQLQYPYTATTRFLDKYGNSKSAESFLPGDVAEIAVSESDQELVSVQLSDAVWVYEDIVNYSIDESIGALIVGNTKYAYDPELSIFSGEGRIGFSDISESDILRAVGSDKKLISLAVQKGHGYLALANTKLFEGSFICVGDRIFEQVEPNMQIEVPEGTYLVTVANNGYGGSREIEIKRDQTVALNLDELKGEGPKVCKITFDVGVEGAVLWIDGKKADYSKPIELAYGVHTIAVEAEGYDTITEKLVVNSKEAEIEIALNSASGSKASDTDSSAKTDTDTDSNNTNQNTNNNNTANNNTGAAGQNNGNTNNNNNSNNNNNNNSSQTDYLTTLYNLLTSIGNTNNNNNNANSSSNTDSNSNSSTDDDDLRDE